MSETKTQLDPEQWIDRHVDAMFGYAVLRVKTPAVAEDLVQDAMLAGLKAMDSFKGGSSERTWLIGILKHKVLDHLRKQGREVRFDHNETDTSELDENFDHSGHWKSQLTDWAEPGRNVENEQLGGALNQCVEALPDKLRTLFVLRELDGVETDELIATLNISSRNNLWVMLSRAREKLRQCMEKSWFQGA